MLRGSAKSVNVSPKRIAVDASLVIDLYAARRERAPIAG